MPETVDWRKVTLGFNSLGHEKVRLYAGVWGGRGGRFWVDDFRFDHDGPPLRLARGSDTLENPEGWLEVLARTPGAVGIMYTTWQNKYALLGPFGELVRKQ